MHSSRIKLNVLPHIIWVQNNNWNWRWYFRIKYTHLTSMLCSHYTLKDTKDKVLITYYTCKPDRRLSIKGICSMREPLIKDLDTCGLFIWHLSGQILLNFIANASKRREISRFEDKWTYDAINLDYRHKMSCGIIIAGR